MLDGKCLRLTKVVKKGVNKMVYFYELVVTAYLNKDIPFQNAQEVISIQVNEAMKGDKQLSERHTAPGLKFYNFSSFYPLEEDKIYKANNIYIFRVRSIDHQFIQKISKLIKKGDAQYFNVLATEVIKKHQQFITQLYTVTPIVVTVARNTHWQIGQDFEQFKKQLHNNTEKKYNQFYNKDIAAEPFFEGIELLNPQTIVVPYKQGYLMGNKLRLHIKHDDVSQCLAHVVLGCGLGEKNSLGMGYCHAH